MREPKRPSDLLGGILRQVRSVATHSETRKALAEALGPELAPRCRVVGMTSGRLLVEVDSAPLYAELRGFRGEELRQAMNERLNGRTVTEIAFRPGKAEDV